MTGLDFTIEFHSDLDDPSLEGELMALAEAELRELAAGHSDIIGASVTIRHPARAETPPLHEATVVAYVRPNRVVGKEKQESVVGALKGALKAVERQVREKRDKLRERWEQPQSDPITQEVVDVVSVEEAEADTVDLSIDEGDEGE